MPIIKKEKRIDTQDRTQTRRRLNSALDSDEDEKKFYEIFGNICDTIAVEHTVPIHSGINYENILREKSLTQFGLPVSEVKICPQPFFYDAN